MGIFAVEQLVSKHAEFPFLITGSSNDYFSNRCWGRNASMTSFKVLVTEYCKSHKHFEKSYKYIDSATNILKLSSS